MDYETRKACTEVCTVLEYMPQEYIKKIPKKIIDLLESRKIENYKVNINKENPIDKNYLSKKAMALIAMLNYMCWCPNQKVKDELFEQYVSNNEKYKEEMAVKYTLNHLCKDKETQAEKEESVNIVKYKESFFNKIFSCIKNIFKIKK